MRRNKRTNKRPALDLNELLHPVRTSSERDQYWLAYDWVKHRLLQLISRALNRISWENGRWTKAFDDLHKRLLREWSRVRTFYRDKSYVDGGYQHKYVDGLIGAFYEALFYYSWLTYAADSWDVMRLREAGDPDYKWSEAFLLQMIPVAEPIPHLFRTRLPDELGEDIPDFIKFEFAQIYGRHPRWSDEVLPQLQADFVLIFDDGKRVQWPLSFFDVKSSRQALETNSESLRRHALAAWLSQNYFYAAYPKSAPDYPERIADWNMGQVCLKCGDLCQLVIDEACVIELECRACQTIMPDRHGLEVCHVCGQRRTSSVGLGNTVVVRCGCGAINAEGSALLTTLCTQSRFGPVERIQGLHQWGLRI